MNGLRSRVLSRSFAPAGDAVLSAAKNINLYFTLISSKVQTGTFLSRVLAHKIYRMNMGRNAEELHIIVKHGRVVTTEHVESKKCKRSKYQTLEKKHLRLNSLFLFIVILVEHREQQS